MTTGHRRDFLLDSGAVSTLAESPRLADAYLSLLQHRLNGSLLIPMPVVAEVRTGDPRYDVPVDRLTNAMRSRQENVYTPLTLDIAERAGVLRTEALRSCDRDISAIDAMIAATADDLADHCAVTILTGDPEDMKLLIGLTRRTNIAVDAPGFDEKVRDARRRFDQLET